LQVPGNLHQEHSTTSTKMGGLQHWYNYCDNTRASKPKP